MIRYREILRLASLEQSAPSIGVAVGCAERTVYNVLHAANKAGLEWPLPKEMGDETIKKLIYPASNSKRGGYEKPDYEQVHRELKRKGVTRALLYEEYCDKCRSAGKSFCSATTFNDGYRKWANSQNITMHIEHKPGQKMEVDWAGTKMTLCDRDAGEFIDVSIFVACLPFSGKLFGEGFLSEDSECWCEAHNHAFAFYGGVPQELVPDNCKTAVISNAFGKDPVLNKAYASLAEYYGCAIAPARVRHPKDKANVEAGVGLITRRAIAALRDRDFFTLDELNAALKEKITEINTAPFTRKPGSRASVFESQERCELAPLPQDPFPICSWERLTVRSNYHIAAKGNFYSVPFEYIGKVVDVCITRFAIEIFYQDVRIASHPRSYAEHDFVTASAHMPENHLNYMEWNLEGLSRQAKEVGPATRASAISYCRSAGNKEKIHWSGQSPSCLGGSLRCRNT